VDVSGAACAPPEETFMTVQELQDQINKLGTDMSAMLAKASAETRELTNDEEHSFDAMNKDRDKLIASRDRWLKVAEIEGQPGPQTRANPLHMKPLIAPVTDADRDVAFRNWVTAGFPEVQFQDKDYELARRCGINLHSKVLSLNLSSRPLRPTAPAETGLQPSSDDLRSWQGRLSEERAALTAAQSTTTTGGYTVADETMQALEIALLQYSTLRGVATVRRTATGGPMPFPTTNDTANKGEIIGENLTSNELEMTFGQLVLDAYKYSSKYVLASIEFLQDTSINANQFIGDMLGTRIARITNDHFTTGTGTSQPFGIVAAAASGVTGVADPPTYDNFVDLVHSVDPAYRVNARFMFNDATLKTLKKIKVLQYSGDATGMPLWQPSMTASQPDTILGYPFLINQSMAGPGSAAKKVLFGDFSKYQIRDVKEVQLMRLDELFALLGQVAFLAISRHDGDLLNAGTNPVKYMAQA
jgi:HK97 family phage major capsid protein